MLLRVVVPVFFFSGYITKIEEIHLKVLFFLSHLRSKLRKQLKDEKKYREKIPKSTFMSSILDLVTNMNSLASFERKSEFQFPIKKNQNNAFQ